MTVFLARTEEKKQIRCSELIFGSYASNEKFTKAIILPWKSVAVSAVYQHFRLYDGISIARTEEKKQIRCSEWRFSDPTHQKLRDKFTKAIIFPWKSVAVAAVYQHFRLYDGIPIARTEEKKQIRCSEWRFSDPTHQKLRDKFTKAIIFPWKSVAVAAVYQHFRLYDGIPIARTEEKKQIRCSEWRFSDPTHQKLRDKFTKAIIFPWKSGAGCRISTF